MIGILCLVGVPLFLELKKSGVAFWIDLIIFIVLLAGWILLTNYLGWRLIGWISVEEDNRR
jgi:Kef-type K+ transport system membrane component KefB